MGASSGVSQIIRNESAQTELDDRFVHLLALLGFACLLGWELTLVFAPSLPLLSFCDLQDAVLLRVFSVLTLVLTFVFCAFRADWAFVHRDKLLAVAFVFALFPVCDALANVYVAKLPFAVSAISWVLAGVSQASIMLYWCVLFSLVPTRRTPVTICCGSLVGTTLYVVINASSLPWVNLTGILLMVIVSVGLAIYLSRSVTTRNALPVHEYHRTPAWSVKASLSIACHGVVYGFMAVELCSMGLEQAIIGGASGIIGTLLALLWGLLGSRVDIDMGIVQRISLPPLVASLLLFPYFEGSAQLACACVANIALAHKTLYSWYSTSVENYEFRLHPVGRFAVKQAPSQVGFCVGSMLAYTLIFVTQTTGTPLYLIMAIVAIVVVTSFSAYGGDESKAKARLDALLAPAANTLTQSLSSSVDADEGEGAPSQFVAFEQSCEKAAEKYALTPREREVFVLLAKGRNAAFIANALGVSSATVKSHIYHIYQKLGINSQQSLIDIVDEGA